MSLLFLDFDGVCHFGLPRHNRPDRENQLFVFLPRLERVLRDFSEVEIVISSSWRETYSWEVIVDVFSNDIRPRVVGATPVLRCVEPPYPLHRRFSEIRQYLHDQGQKSEPWVALDDDANLFPLPCANLILCADGFRQAEEVALRTKLTRMRCIE